MTTQQDLQNDATERLARREWPATPIRRQIAVSFEFFPPASPTATRNLFECAEQLDRFQPRFMSVTYGAGGTNQSRTRNAVADLSLRTRAPIAGHLTAVGASKAAVRDVIDGYVNEGVRHIVALRGDTTDEVGPHPDGFVDAADLVKGIRHQVDDPSFEISVACYPEVHPLAESAEADLDNLKKKIDAGATRAITQFFFDTDSFLRFVERARKAGIDVPIVPGIMPVTNFARIRSFSERCGATIPAWMPELFGDLDGAPEIRQLVAATVAAEQCRRLAEHGVDTFHFYTMNQPALTASTCHILGVRSTEHETHGDQSSDARSASSPTDKQEERAS